MRISIVLAPLCSSLLAGTLLVGCAHQPPPPRAGGSAAAVGAAVDEQKRHEPYNRSNRNGPFMAEPVLEPAAPPTFEGAAPVVGVASAPIGDSQGVRVQESLDDKKIVSIARTSTQLDGELARAGVQRASDMRVRRLANEIVKRQAETQKKLERFAEKQGPALTPSTVAERLSADGKQTLTALGTKRGPAFDRAYLKAQMTSHRDTINLIDEQLIPGATDQQVVELVREIRPALEQDYARARALSEKLGK